MAILNEEEKKLLISNGSNKKQIDATISYYRTQKGYSDDKIRNLFLKKYDYLSKPVSKPTTNTSVNASNKSNNTVQNTINKPLVNNNNNPKPNNTANAYSTSTPYLDLIKSDNFKNLTKEQKAEAIKSLGSLENDRIDAEKRNDIKKYAQNKIDEANNWEEDHPYASMFNSMFNPTYYANKYKLNKMAKTGDGKTTVHDLGMMGGTGLLQWGTMALPGANVAKGVGLASKAVIPKMVSKGVVNKLSNAGVKEVGKTMLKNAGANATAFAGFSGADQLSREDNSKEAWIETAKNAGLGATMGLATGLASPLVGKGLSKFGSNQLRNTAFKQTAEHFKGMNVSKEEQEKYFNAVLKELTDKSGKDVASNMLRGLATSFVDTSVMAGVMNGANKLQGVDSTYREEFTKVAPFMLLGAGAPAVMAGLNSRPVRNAVNKFQNGVAKNPETSTKFAEILNALGVDSSNGSISNMQEFNKLLAEKQSNNFNLNESQMKAIKLVSKLTEAEQQDVYKLIKNGYPIEDAVEKVVDANYGHSEDFFKKGNKEQVNEQPVEPTQPVDPMAPSEPVDPMQSTKQVNENVKQQTEQQVVEQPTEQVKTDEVKNTKDMTIEEKQKKIDEIVNQVNEEPKTTQESTTTQEPVEVKTKEIKETKNDNTNNKTENNNEEKVDEIAKALGTKFKVKKLGKSKRRKPKDSVVITHVTNNNEDFHYDSSNKKGKEYKSKPIEVDKNSEQTVDKNSEQTIAENNETKVDANKQEVKTKQETETKTEVQTKAEEIHTEVKSANKEQNVVKEDTSNKSDVSNNSANKIIGDKEIPFGEEQKPSNKQPNEAYKDNEQSKLRNEYNLSKDEYNNLYEEYFNSSDSDKITFKEFLENKKQERQEENKRSAKEYYKNSRKNKLIKKYNISEEEYTQIEQEYFGDKKNRNVTFEVYVKNRANKINQKKAINEQSNNGNVIKGEIKYPKNEVVDESKVQHLESPKITDENRISPSHETTKGKEKNIYRTVQKFEENIKYVEPNELFDFLPEERAKELREKYREVPVTGKDGRVHIELFEKGGNVNGSDRLLSKKERNKLKRELIKEIKESSSYKDAMKNFEENKTISEEVKEEFNNNKNVSKYDEGIKEEEVNLTDGDELPSNKLKENDKSAKKEFEKIENDATNEVDKIADYNGDAPKEVLSVLKDDNFINLWNKYKKSGENKRYQLIKSRIKEIIKECEENGGNTKKEIDTFIGALMRQEEVELNALKEKQVGKYINKDGFKSDVSKLLTKLDKDIKYSDIKTHSKPITDAEKNFVEKFISKTFLKGKFKSNNKGVGNLFNIKFSGIHKNMPDANIKEALKINSNKTIDGKTIKDIINENSEKDGYGKVAQVRYEEMYDTILHADKAELSDKQKAYALNELNKIADEWNSKNAKDKNAIHIKKNLTTGEVKNILDNELRDVVKTENSYESAMAISKRGANPGQEYRTREQFRILEDHYDKSAKTTINSIADAFDKLNDKEFIKNSTPEQRLEIAKEIIGKLDREKNVLKKNMNAYSRDKSLDKNSSQSGIEAIDSRISNSDVDAYERYDRNVRATANAHIRKEEINIISKAINNLFHNDASGREKISGTFDFSSNNTFAVKEFKGKVPIVNEFIKAGLDENVKIKIDNTIRQKGSYKLESGTIIVRDLNSLPHEMQHAIDVKFIDKNTNSKYYDAYIALKEQSAENNLQYKEFYNSENNKKIINKFNDLYKENRNKYGKLNKEQVDKIIKENFTSDEQKVLKDYKDVVHNYRNSILEQRAIEANKTGKPLKQSVEDFVKETLENGTEESRKTWERINRDADLYGRRNVSDSRLKEFYSDDRAGQHRPRRDSINNEFNDVDFTENVFGEGAKKSNAEKQVNIDAERIKQKNDNINKINDTIREQTKGANKKSFSDLTKNTFDYIKKSSDNIEKIRIKIGTITEEQALNRKKMLGGENATYIVQRRKETADGYNVDGRKSKEGIYGKSKKGLKNSDLKETMIATFKAESDAKALERIDEILKSDIYKPYKQGDAPLDGYIPVNDALLNSVLEVNGSTHLYRAIDGNVENIGKIFKDKNEAKGFTDLHNRTREKKYQMPVVIFNKMLSGDGELVSEAFSRYYSGNVSDLFFSKGGRYALGKLGKTFVDWHTDAFKRMALATTSFIVNNRISNASMMIQATKNPLTLIKSAIDSKKIKYEDIPQELMENALEEACRNSMKKKVWTGWEEVDDFLNLMSGHDVDTTKYSSKKLKVAKTKTSINNPKYNPKLASTLNTLKTISIPNKLYNSLSSKLLDFNTKWERIERNVLFTNEVNKVRKALIKETCNKAITTEEASKYIQDNPVIRGVVLKNIEDILGNYNNFSRFERHVLKRIIPFYSWMRTITRVTMKNAIKNPARLGLILSLKNRIEEQDEDLKDYQKGSFRLPISDPRSGKQLLLNKKEYLFPIETLTDFQKEGKQSTLSSLNPLITKPIEAIAGGKAFNSKDGLFNGEITNKNYYRDYNGDYVNIKTGKKSKKLPAHIRAQYLAKELAKPLVPVLSNNLIKGESLIGGALNIPKNGKFIEPDKMYDSSLFGYSDGDYIDEKHKRFASNNTSQSTKVLQRLGLGIQPKQPLNKKEKEALKEKAKKYKGKHKKQ